MRFRNGFWLEKSRIFGHDSLFPLQPDHRPLMNPASLPPTKSPSEGAEPARKPRRKLLYIIVGACILAAGAFAWKVHSRKAGQVEAVTTEKAVIRTITQLVTATGKIQPEIEVKITPEVYGEIVELPFREGARVRKGDLIVAIKPDLYQAQVDQQIAAVASARGASVDSKAKVEKAESDMTQYEDLHQRKLVSDSDYITYKTNLDVARADYVAALANVQMAEGILAQSRDALSKTRIYSPMDGTVSSRSCEVGERVQAATSFAGTEIMRVADLSNMEVQINVNENDIPNVKVGDHAVISIDSYPDRKFSGFVKEIASSAENSGATSGGTAAQASTSSTDEVTNFLVKIRVADRDVQLRPGMSATADIETQTVKDAVAVPIQSVTVRAEGGLTTEDLQKKLDKEAADKTGNSLTVQSEKDDARRNREQLQRVVFIKVGDKVRMQKVDSGIADNTWIEVKSGVKPGDEIVSGTYAAISRKLKDGMAVKIDKPKKDADQN
jgi:HlyD family secretion protein